MLSKKQLLIIDYIKKYQEANSVSPSLEEIKKSLKLSAVSTAYYHVNRLQEEGYLQKESNHPRTLSLRGDFRSVKIPLVGKITAGEPIEAIETQNEYISVLLDEPLRDKIFALKVSGNSMVEDGIFDGDTVVVRKQEVAENGETVVAIINGNHATLKRFYREEDRFRLQPANSALLPTFHRTLEIRGVVIKIVRDLESKFVRKIDYSWDFRGENTKTYTHGLHNYPAMFIPQVARRLIETYSKKGDTVCDIFCGSGTALVESKTMGRNAVGVDLNPLATFLAKVKVTEINPSILSLALTKIIDGYHKVDVASVINPSFKNIDFWFKENIILDLAKLKQIIRDIKDQDVEDFFLVAFSEVVRTASNSKNGEFKLVRIKEEKLLKHQPKVIELFKKKAEANILFMQSYFEDCDKNIRTEIKLADSSKNLEIKDESIDFIITSPPYGDSRTTVAYGQFSRLSAQWLDLYQDANSASGLDNELLGGRVEKAIINTLSSNYLKEVLEKIALKDQKRANEVLSFFLGLNKCLEQAYRILKTDKYFCVIVGNRLVKQVRIPTDFIIAEMAQNFGFRLENIFVRNIPGKRMPSKNSPTNIAGALEETMLKESIVIMKKAR